MLRYKVYTYVGLTSQVS